MRQGILMLFVVPLNHYSRLFAVQYEEGRAVVLLSVVVRNTIEWRIESASRYLRL